MDRKTPEGRIINRRSPLQFVPPPVRLNSKGEANMTRAQVQAWASDLGISEDELMMVITLHSERGGAPHTEHQWIARTMVNRREYPSTFGSSMWWISTGGSKTTGMNEWDGLSYPDGDRRGRYRQYASTRPPTNARAASYLLGVARDALERGGVRSSGPEGMLNFHHHKGGAKAKTDERWIGLGYIPHTIGDGTYFSPGQRRVETMA